MDPTLTRRLAVTLGLLQADSEEGVSPYALPITIAMIVASAVVLLGGVATVRRRRLEAEAAARAAKEKALKEQRAKEEKLKAERRLPQIRVHFGSQTGAAEGFAKTIVDTCKRHGFVGKLLDLDSFDGDDFVTPANPDEKARSITVFVVATYGEGDPSDNAVKFHGWVKSKLEGEGLEKANAALLSGRRYCVFGLGNKQYEHYNAMGKFVDSSMEKLGATRVYKYGEGDDDGGKMDEDFSNWAEDLYDALKLSQFGTDGPPTSHSTMNGTHAASSPASDGNGGQTSSSSGMNNFTVDFKLVSRRNVAPLKQFEANGNQGEDVDEEAADDDYRFDEVRDAERLTVPVTSVDFASRAFFKARRMNVLSITELRQKHAKFGYDPKATGELGSTLHVELQLPEGVSYRTAYNLSVLPENDPAVVAAAAKSLGFDLEERFELFEGSNEGSTRRVSGSRATLFPTPCTMRTALSCYVALNTVPSKIVLEKLSLFARDPAHKARLQLLASKAGKTEFHAYITERKTRLYEVLADFPSWGFDEPANFFEIVPLMAPRDYTIASSDKMNPRQVHLVVSVVREPLPEDRVFGGVCTNALARRRMAMSMLRVPAPVYAFVKPSTFAVPSDPSLPLILIGPGTGVAPMRALIHERAYERKQNLRPGPCYLFFGCRRKDEDFIYREEMEEYVKQGVVELFVAFSRQDPGKKVYVTHLIEQQAELVVGAIHRRGAVIYVCGGTQMGRDVTAALERAVETQLMRGKPEEAKRYVQKLHMEGRYFQELWS